MARDPAWTEQLGNAILTQYPDVMDAVQRMRRLARRYGYLTTNGYINVIETGEYIRLLPVNPDVLYVPYYDPLVVFAPPRPGLGARSTSVATGRAARGFIDCGDDCAGRP